MVKMVNFMLCVFYQNFLISHKKKKKKNFEKNQDNCLVSNYLLQDTY